jgi:integrase
VEFESATLHRRVRGGATGTHPLLADELRALRTLKREAKSPLIFVSEKGAPFTVAGLAKLVERAGIEAKIGFKVHPHTLRHAAGKGHDTRTLQAYLELARGRFKNFLALKPAIRLHRALVGQSNPVGSWWRPRVAVV